MSEPAASRAGTPPSPAETWDALIRPEVEGTADYWADLSERMRDARLTFGGRPLCPFLRPFFIDAADEVRVRAVAETIAAIGERVVAAAMAQPELLQRVRLTEAETRLARIDPGYGRASTTSRLDAFLLPGSLTFAEYNAESPAGLAYAENLGEVFDGLEVMARFRERFDASYFTLSMHLLDALLASYAEWGGRASPPTILITDFREVPTWSEFLILKDRFEARGVPTVVADPRDLTFDGTTLVADGQRIDMVYRRVLVNDVIARADDCRVLVEAIASGKLCMANALRCKIPHKKAFFALLTDDDVIGQGGLCRLSDAERAVIGPAIPWTRVVEDVRTTSPHHGTIDLLDYACEYRDSLVLKPNDEYGGTGVTLGWETSVGDWDAALQKAVAGAAAAEAADRSWVLQHRIPIRRESFLAVTGPPHAVAQRDMLVDFAPYLFRGRQVGCLTRLSGSGLANVTSGGGQAAAFVVRAR
ncbi:MAG: hypothetical protein ABIT71_17570 [Vicinamibacteraceae bacterium]